MAAFTVLVFTESTQSLDEIAAVVQETERSGRLLAISPCENFPPRQLTCFTHEEGAAPEQPIELHLCPGGEIPDIPGKTLVCFGSCFVDTSLRKVAAFR